MCKSVILRFEIERKHRKKTEVDCMKEHAEKTANQGRQKERNEWHSEIEVRPLFKLNGAID